jgi:hypothetical protein
MQSVHITTNIVLSKHGHGWRGVLDTVLCNKDCHGLVVGWLFSPGSLGFSFTADRDDIIEIFLRVALNTTTSLDMHDISVIVVNPNIMQIMTTTPSDVYSELEEVQQYSKQYTDKRRKGLDKQDIDF